MTILTKLELLKHARSYLQDLPVPANRVLRSSEFECVLSSLRYTYKIRVNPQLIVSLTSDFESISTMRLATGQVNPRTDKKTEVLAILDLMIEGTIE